MKKFVSFLFIFFIFSTTCTGCQLANPELSADADQLVGIYATTEFIPLDDNEKLYGTFDSANQTLTFPDTSGHFLLSHVFQKNGEEYHSVIGDISTKTHIIDKAKELDGTLYIHKNLVKYEEDEEYFDEEAEFEAFENTDDSEEVEGDSLYIYPIYLTATGKYYLENVDDSLLMNVPYERHSFFNSKIDNGDWLPNTPVSKISIGLEAVKPCVEFTFSRIGYDGVVQKEDTFFKDTIPESYSFSSDCNYVLVTKRDSYGNVTHDVIDRGDEFFKLYIEEDNIFCSMTTIDILP